MSEDHWIVPGPKMKLRGPNKEKASNVPSGWLGMRSSSSSKKKITSKEVAVRGIPMASAVGVMTHVSLLP